ncbi:MAG: hypothetical protein J7639_28720, partial [Paenibacillaceae bacterium]|nr:hypothetical protein [Paenibacillaceae bacterium]
MNDRSDTGLLTAHAAFGDTGNYIAPATGILSDNAVIRRVIERLRCGEAPAWFAQVAFQRSVPASIRAKAEAILACSYKEHPEGYILDIAEEAIAVYASSDRGLLYGAHMLAHLAKGGWIRCGIVYNRP